MASGVVQHCGMESEAVVLWHRVWSGLVVLEQGMGSGVVVLAHAIDSTLVGLDPRLILGMMFLEQATGSAAVVLEPEMVSGVLVPGPWLDLPCVLMPPGHGFPVLPLYSPFVGR